ncbi:MAG TPA: glycosyltransferase [bacterium]|nr:glycosyltransferase [bacterium]
MRVMILNTDYPAFLRDLVERHQGFAEASYAKQLQLRNESLFGVFDAYSHGFQANGEEAWEVHANNGLMQRRWMIEHGLQAPRGSARRPSRLSRLARRVARRLRMVRQDTRHTLLSPFDVAPWDLGEMLLARVAHDRPDVVLNHAVSEIGSDLLERMRPHTRLIVGQIASPLPEAEDYRAYDLMVSSLPNFVAYYEQRGLQAHLNCLAFDPRVLEAIGPLQRTVEVSFVGSLSRAHAGRVALVEHLAARSDIAIWGNGVERLDADSPVRAHYQGEAWGADMFRVLGRSRITVNHHIGIAGPHANNMRLFEATGMGALLITDRKSDIGELFEPGREVVCYDSPQECLELIDYYRRHESERDRIADAGQRRTLRDHTYRQRTEGLAQIFREQLVQRGQGVQ